MQKRQHIETLHDTMLPRRSITQSVSCQRIDNEHSNHGQLALDGSTTSSFEVPSWKMVACFFQKNNISPEKNISPHHLNRCIPRKLHTSAAFSFFQPFLSSTQEPPLINTDPCQSNHPLPTKAGLSRDAPACHQNPTVVPTKTKALSPRQQLLHKHVHGMSYILRINCKTQEPMYTVST